MFLLRVRLFIRRGVIYGGRLLNGNYFAVFQRQLNISLISWRRIFYKDLGMKDYVVQIVQELKPVNRRFAQLAEDEQFYRKIAQNKIAEKIKYKNQN